MSSKEFRRLRKFNKHQRLMRKYCSHKEVVWKYGINEEHLSVGECKDCGETIYCEV